MSLHEGDLKAGVIGLVAGTVLLLAVTFTIVKLTNASHAKHAAPAGAQSHAPADAPAATPAPGTAAPAAPAANAPAPGSH